MDPFQEAIVSNMASCNIYLDKLVQMILRGMERTGGGRGGGGGRVVVKETYLYIASAYLATTTPPNPTPAVPSY